MPAGGGGWGGGEGRWVYTFFVILRDGKLGEWVVLDKVRDVMVKKSLNYFCIIKEKIAYMECVIQSSMFYSFNLFLSILFVMQIVL